MSYQFQPPFEVNDFSGGITDNYIDCPKSQYQKADNYFIEKNEKLLSRGGMVIYDSSATRITGNTRIGSMINHPGSELWFQTDNDIYRISSGAFSQLTGPVDSNPFMYSSSTTNYISTTKWKNHTYSVSDAFDLPKKIYKDNNGTWQLRNAGLPSVELEGAIDLLNAIRTAYIVHIADATEHATADTTNTVTAGACNDLDSAITLCAELLTDFNAHEADDDSDAGSYHQAQEGSDATLSDTTSPTSLSELLDRVDDLKSKFNTHDADSTSHTAGSQHQVSVVRTPAISGSGSDTYIYRFIYRYKYYVGEVLFENLSSYASVTQASLTTGTKSISSIPAISNGSNQCYDTANITVEIYRTTSGGTTFYKVGSVTNGTTTFSDTVTDGNLVLNTVLYTDGSVLEHDAPPAAKYITVVNDIAWYAHVKEGSNTYSTRFRQSVKGNPDACPASFSEDVEADITGISNVGIYPIVLARDRVWRIEGFYDRFGRGTIEKREISREKGCVSNDSIVKIPATDFSPAGVVFAGTDGFYFSDGYVVKLISTHLISSYSDIVTTTAEEVKIYGRYNSEENRVHWTCTDNSLTGSDNNRVYVLDLNFRPAKPDEWVFTTLSSPNSWSASAIEFYNGDYVVADYRGYIFKYSTSTITDPKIDTSKTVANWDTLAITWDYRSFATTLGTTAVYKFVPSITLQAKNYGNVSVQIKSNNEDSGYYRALKEIRVRDGITWGDPSIPWGDTTYNYPWNTFPIVRTLRLFPTGHLRCIYKQIQITNSDTIVYNSDNLGTATVDSTNKTVTLNDGTKTVPTDVVSYSIAFDDDSYSNTFLITSRDSSSQLTYSDVSSLSNDQSTAAWIIRGTRKGERLNLLSYTLNFAPVYQHQSVYRGETGGNA